MGASARALCVHHPVRYAGDNNQSNDNKRTSLNMGMIDTGHIGTANVRYCRYRYCIIGTVDADRKANRSLSQRSWRYRASQWNPRPKQVLVTDTSVRFLCVLQQDRHTFLGVNTASNSPTKLRFLCQHRQKCYSLDPMVRPNSAPATTVLLPLVGLLAVVM